ncbi:MAG: trypsin-like peptidase domain-containing protein [Nitrospinae bacterium]|nr:trypsin-like peptidase domain-containing protein [Nitrospinota bacterium]
MALIPPFSFNCVVAIGTRDSGKYPRWVGTGTLIGRFFKKRADGQRQYHIFIVTNKHVVEGQDSIVVRFNPLAALQAKDYDIPLVDRSGKTLWREHPGGTLDIAVIGINADFLAEENVRYDFFQSDNHLMPIAEMSALGVSEGDFIYVLGFPMGIVDPDRQYVIARSGIIARLRDALEGHKKDFLIDAFIFPGNSGGPVLYKPEIVSLEGTQSVVKPGLIGIVSGYLTYKDTAISQQTGHPRVVFEENSGLAAAVPVDFVMEAIEACFASLNIKERDSIRPANS